MPINDVGPCTRNPRHLLQVPMLPWVDSIRWLTNRLALWPGAARPLGDWLISYGVFVSGALVLTNRLLL